VATDENLFNVYLKPHEELQKILAMLREKEIPEHISRINSIGNTIDKLREKLAQSQELGVCLWCGNNRELTCLYGHVLLEVCLLKISAIRAACLPLHRDK